MGGKNSKKKLIKYLENDSGNYHLYEWKIKQNDNWIIYDPINQKILEKMFQTIKKKWENKEFDPNEFLPFNLAWNYTHHKINILKFKGRDEYLSCEIKIIRRKIKDIDIENIIKKYNDNDFRFFWNSQNDPFLKESNVKWTPYDLELQRKFKKFYAINRMNKFYSRYEFKNKNDYFIDFDIMMQIKKNETFKQRRIQRTKSELINNITRNNRFFHCDAKISEKPKINIFKKEEKLISDDNYFNVGHKVIDFLNIGKDDQKDSIKLIEIQFNVIKNFPLKIKINKDLCKLEDGSIINTSFKSFIKLLEKEISDLGILYDINDAILEYLHIIKEVENSHIFFEKIYKIYTEEGFLYRKLNEFLRNFYIEGIKKIENFYISLLASFEYATSLKIPEEIISKGDLIVYRVSRTNDEEINEYEENNNKNIIRVFNEFLSTSRNFEKIHPFFENIDDEKKGFLWEIRIPERILIDNRQSFAFIENFSAFKGEEEVLIKSGSVLLIEEIVPYKNMNKNNVYLKKCILKDFDILNYLKTIKFDNSSTYLALIRNELESNPENIKKLFKGLKDSQIIKSLCIAFHHLGSNIENIKQLCNGLIENPSIEELNLEANELGSNPENIRELCEGLKDNKSIKRLNLDRNQLGLNVENIRELSKGLKDNQSIKKLDLFQNQLGSNVENIRELCKGLNDNKSIENLDLWKNQLGSNKENINELCKGLKENKTIKELYVWGNELDQNEIKKIKDELINIRIFN